MCCFVNLLLSNEMQMSVRRFSAIPHLRAREVDPSIHARLSSSASFIFPQKWKHGCTRAKFACRAGALRTV